MNNFRIVSLAEYRYRPSKAWTRYNENNKKYLTDGHMLIKRECIKPLKRMLEQTGTWELPIHVKDSSLKQVWDRWDSTFQKAEVGEFVRITGVSRKHELATVTISRNGNSAFFCADKVKMIMGKVKDCTFYLNPENTANEAAWIKSGRKLVGCIMPVRP